MNKQQQGFAAAWNRYWTREREGVPVTLDHSPAYPIARTVPMPEGHRFATGALAFRIGELKLDGLERLTDLQTETRGKRVRLAFSLADVSLRGRYTLEVKPDPVIDLDTAGNLMELPTDVTRPVAGGADGDDGQPDPQKEEWLNNARDQRTKLSNTDSGQKLLGMYNVHNEVYDEVFRESPTLGTLWKNGGVTRAMAGDTHEAVQQDDQVINSPDKRYSAASGQEFSYNMNAFIQQVNVATSCLYQDPDFDPYSDPEATGSKYWEAARAALSFSKGVTENTNNSKSNSNPMTTGQVYGTVDQHDSLPVVSDQEVLSLAAQGPNPGGAAALALPDWLELDEEDRERIRYIFESTMKHRAENAAIKGEALFSGDVEARFDRVDAVVELGVGATDAQVLSARVDLPAFALDIDDAAWSGEAAEVARKRLASMYFIRSLLHESLVKQLAESLGSAAIFALNECKHA